MKFPVVKVTRFNWKLKRVLVRWHEQGGCVQDFLKAHDVSLAEFQSWIIGYNRGGNRGLMITKKDLA